MDKYLVIRKHHLSSPRGVAKMRLGYTILAEALIRSGKLTEALQAAENLEEGYSKTLLIREIRNNAI